MQDENVMTTFDQTAKITDLLPFTLYRIQVLATNLFSVIRRKQPDLVSCTTLMNSE